MPPRSGTGEEEDAEAELIAAVICAQYLLHVLQILNASRLLMELPMMFIPENIGALDIVNGWNSGGQNRQVDTRL